MRINKLAWGGAIACASLIAGSSIAYGSLPFRLPPRNVILVIGDGMDDQQITIARNYLVGAFGELNLDRLPLRGSAQVLTYEEELPLKMTYVADSANGGTSIATGGVTSTGRIGTTVVEDLDLTNILELARAAGYKTGVVTTASVTDATPAAFLSHVSFRSCEGPNDMGGGIGPGCLADKKANGGKGSIAEQIADSNANVVLGGGITKFGQLAEGSSKTVLQTAQENGFNYVSTAAALDAYTGNGRLLGLFSNSTMPVKLSGATATRVTFDASNQPVMPAATTCTANPAFASVPTLAAMTEKAMEVLSKNNPRGFILVIESASVDKQAHARNPCGHIGEMEQLDEVVGLARDFAEDSPNTLLLVTADHGQSPQLIPEGSSLPRPDGSTPYPLGHIARVNTHEGTVMRISYATTSGAQEDHTGTEVPVLAFGADPFNRIKGFMPQPEVFTIMKRHLRVQ